MTEEKQETEPTSVIKKLEVSVNDLFHFRDHYFEIKDLNCGEQKRADVEKQLQLVISLFNDLEEEAMKEDRAMYYYLLGKAYNIGTNYHSKAEELLSKAAKLNPNFIDAWNELGEVLFKAEKFSEAKDCFENALTKERNKVSLRSLSFFARTNAESTMEDRLKNFMISVKQAKEAVDLDPTDGMSWCVLANAYMMYFFNGKKSASFLNCAIEAYQRAQEDVVSNYQADMHHNRGMIFKYMEDYRKALEGFEMAMLIEPWWALPKTRYESLQKYLNQCQSSVDRKGNMKSKKLNSLIAQLNAKHLGRYVKEFRVGDTFVLLKNVPFSKLKVGENTDKIVVGIVVCSVYNEEQVPFTFCLVDSEGSCFLVTLYNLASGAGVLIGDFVAIPIPRHQHVNFAYKQKIYDYKSIRVESPQSLVINGKDFKLQDVSNVTASVSSYHSLP